MEPKVYRDDQHTSKAVAVKYQPARLTREQTVLNMIKGLEGNRGAIPEEIAAASGMDLIDVRRAFSVLRKKNLIVYACEDRKNNRDNWCGVFRAVIREA